MQTNNPKVKRNITIAVASILLVVPIVFILILIFGNSKNNKGQTDPQQQNQQAQKVSPEEKLINALKISKTDSSETALFNLALAYNDNKMHKEGIDLFLKVVKINPKHVIAYNNLGFSYGCLGEWDNGIKYCQMALDLDPNFQLAKNNLNWMKDEKKKASK